MENKIATVLERLTQHSPGAVRVSSVSGGSINRACKVRCDVGVFFVKVNSATAFPGMFEAEEKGLDLLRASTFTVPKTFGVATEGSDAFIVMEYIDSAPPAPDFSERFAQCLGDLHQGTNQQFGLDHNNYIGSLPQSNRLHDEWPSFFASERIEPQMKQGRDSGLLSSEDARRAERLSASLVEFFPAEAPSLLHGDLWSGNYMCDAAGAPAIIDPAVYYGHRYMDLGMMQLFGGFDRTIFDRYGELCQLDSGWREGSEVANLYPLLVHVNLFGAGYVSQVRSILRRYS